MSNNNNNNSGNQKTTSTFSNNNNGVNGESSSYVDLGQDIVKKPRVAIIGGGVSGLACAWQLSKICNYHVDIFEANPQQLGGHAYTVSCCNTTTTTNDDDKQNSTNSIIDVDIGFMVYNDANYPNMIQWFNALEGVEEELSDMSLSVSLDGGNTVEWSSDGGISGLFGGGNGNWKQAISPKFYMFLKDMIRFNHTACDLLLLHDDDPRKHLTVKQYLHDHKYSESFMTYYLLPMMAALWSASLDDVLNFPAYQLVSFLANHKMLQLFDRPTWKTVSGRSKQYVNAVSQDIGGTDHIFLNTEIVNILVTTSTTTDDDDNDDKKLYTLQTNKKSDGRQEYYGKYDHVVFACHPPTAASILELEKTNAGNFDDIIETLKQIEYADNVIYVHSDPTLMPKHTSCWASWNCLGKSEFLQQQLQQQQQTNNNSSGSLKKKKPTQQQDDDDDDAASSQQQEEESPCLLEGEEGRFKAVYVTYWLNRLQNLDTDTNIFVSLNPHHRPDPALTHHRVIMAHPQFQPGTLKARENIENGKDGLWFCGAWMGYGFHEDGCRSGFEVATALSGVPLPWAIKEDAADADENGTMEKVVVAPVLPPPDLALANHRTYTGVLGFLQKMYRLVSYDLPISICKRFIYYFLENAVQHGSLRLKFNDGTIQLFGDGTPCGCDTSPVTLRIFDPWFFVKTALEYDLGLARSYMAGYFQVEPLDDTTAYHPVLRPPQTRDETSMTIGDPVGLTRLFLLLIGNRDKPAQEHHVAKKSGSGHYYSHALTTASGLFLSKIGSLFNYLWYKLTMDNSEVGGSLRNIQAHYDLSNDLFRTFLDKETLMYSSAIYDAIAAPIPQTGLVFRGTLEEAQCRKLDTLLARAQVQPGQTILDIGFGWGGLSIHAAKKFGCKVTGITLSVEQKALAEERVREEGLESLMTFEVIDYRTFARRKENQGKFDRVLSCEMIEAVGHRHLGAFFWAVEQLLAHDGILVMEAITTPENRYENYIRSTDFINTVIFPGSCCPSLHSLVDAAYQQSTLTLEHIDNIGLHYAQTLAEWRRRFNASESTVRDLGFDDVFLRAWNYYLTYCEAGFFSQTENCLILVFARSGCTALIPLCETRSVTQQAALSTTETMNWLTDGLV